MASPDDFLPYVLPYVAGCSFPLAVQHIVDTCKDFCAFTNIVQEQLDPIDAVMDQAGYEIDTTFGTDVAMVLHATYQGRPLRRVNMSEAPTDFMLAGAGTPSAFIKTAGNILVLDRAPAQDAPQAISMLVSTQPRTGATRLADVLFKDYAYQIGLGAVGRLLLIPGQKFSRPGDAAAYTAQYLSTRAAARVRTEMTFGTAPLRVRPRPFQ